MEICFTLLTHLVTKCAKNTDDQAKDVNGIFNFFFMLIIKLCIYQFILHVEFHVAYMQTKFCFKSFT